MKCIKIKDGAIYNIMLNEACSSGCGSFIETYAKSVDMSVSDFAEEAIHSREPVDLGTRCTVFMNSKVKQAQKEGATIGDISAGLSYSVIKNALYKVIKLRDVSEGRRTYRRSGRYVPQRRDTAEHRDDSRQGCDPSGYRRQYGSIWRRADRTERQWKEMVLAAQTGRSGCILRRIPHTRCGRCENNCLLTINGLTTAAASITGNRCERAKEK